MFAEPSTPASRPAGTGENLTVVHVDTDARHTQLTSEYLGSHGLDVSVVTRGDAALSEVLRVRPDVVLLDIALGTMDGLAVCRSIREHLDVPIIIVTARGEEADRVVGLEMGADDYVTKPFSPRELGARVKALLRRTEPVGETPRVIESRGLTIDPSSYRVSHDGSPVTLSTLEFRLLYYLATRPNRVFSRDQLLDAVWGTERFVTPRSVDVYIRRLREKVETDADHPSFLKTVRGAGYMFENAGQAVKQE